MATQWNHPLLNTIGGITQKDIEEIADALGPCQAALDVIEKLHEVKAILDSAEAKYSLPTYEELVDSGNVEKFAHIVWDHNMSAEDAAELLHPNNGQLRDIWMFVEAVVQKLGRP